MKFQFIRYFMQLLNNEHVIGRLAESRPIRRAAQMVASIIIRVKQIEFPKMNQIEQKGVSTSLRDFIARVKQELKQPKDGIKKQAK